MPPPSPHAKGGSLPEIALTRHGQPRPAGRAAIRMMALVMDPRALVEAMPGG